jgi:hypothetical protein
MHGSPGSLLKPYLRYTDLKPLYLTNVWVATHMSSINSVRPAETWKELGHLLVIRAPALVQSLNSDRAPAWLHSLFLVPEDWSNAGVLLEALIPIYCTTDIPLCCSSRTDQGEMGGSTFGLFISMV